MLFLFQELRIPNFTLDRVLSKKEMKEYINQTLEDSIFKFDIDVNEDDKLLSLITCTRMFGAYSTRELRVDARLVRDGEIKTNYDVEKTDKYEEIEELMKVEKTMIKRKRIVVGVLLVVVCFAAIVGIRSFSSSSEVAGVERNETSAPTKDGSKCSDPDMLAERYKPDVTYNSDGTQATITVARGTFRATAVSAVNLDGGSIPYTNLILLIQLR